MQLKYFEWSSAMGNIPHQGNLVIHNFPYSLIDGVREDGLNVRFFADSNYSQQLDHMIYYRHGINLTIVEFPSGFTGNRLYINVQSLNYIYPNYFKINTSNTYVQRYDIYPVTFNTKAYGNHRLNKSTSDVSLNGFVCNGDTTANSGGTVTFRNAPDHLEHLYSHYVVCKINSASTIAQRDIFPFLPDYATPDLLTPANVGAWKFLLDNMVFAHFHNYDGKGPYCSFMQKDESEFDDFHAHSNGFVNYVPNQMYMLRFHNKQIGSSYFPVMEFDKGGSSETHIQATRPIISLYWTDFYIGGNSGLNGYMSGGTGKGTENIFFQLFMSISKDKEKIANDYGLNYVWKDSYDDFLNKYENFLIVYNGSDYMGTLLSNQEQYETICIPNFLKGLISLETLDNFYDTQILEKFNEVYSYCIALKLMYHELVTNGKNPSAYPTEPTITVPKYEPLENIEATSSGWLYPNTISNDKKPREE